MSSRPFTSSRVASVLAAAALSAGVLALAPTASAHIDLVVPSPRHADPLLDQKDGPCGVAGSPRSAEPTVYMPGDPVTISWSEPVQHDSHFRLAFLVDGEDFPLPVAFDDFCDPAEDDWCLADDILDDQIEGTFDYEWTIPDTPCDNCTLQLIQVMYDADGLQENDFYYDCADIVILDPGGTTSATTSASSGGGEEGSGGSTPGGGGSTGDGDGDGSGDGDGNGNGNGSDGGASGDGGATAASTTTGDALEPRTFPDDSGCAVSAPGRGGAIAALLAPLALALGALALRGNRR